MRIPSAIASHGRIASGFSFLLAGAALLVATPAAAQQPLPPLPPPSQQPPPPPQPYYAPQYAPPGAPEGYGPSPVYGQPPPQYGPPPSYYYGPRPPPPVVYVEPEAPVHAPRFSLWLGARLGLIGFGGDFFQNQSGQGETTGNFVKTGVNLELDAGVRLGKRYLPYVFYEHGAMAPGHRFDGASSVTASEDFLGAGFRYTAGDVDSVGFLSDIAIGVRQISVSDGTNTYRMSTIEYFRLGLGAEIRLSTRFVLSPMATVSGGTMTDTNGTINYGSVGDGITQPTFTNGKQIDGSSQRGYVVVGLGCGGHFDLLGK